MRVFLDTNVLVAAVATRGLSADVVRLVLAEHELVTAEIVLEELRRVLSEKLGLPGGAVRDALALLEEGHVEPTVDADPPLEIRDPPDARILATALGADADVLVTGDRDLLSVAGDVSGLLILDPRGFWEEVRG